jgi:hypothetical protein
MMNVTTVDRRQFKPSFFENGLAQWVKGQR